MDFVSSDLDLPTDDLERGYYQTVEWREQGRNVENRDTLLCYICENLDELRFFHDEAKIDLVVVAIIILL